MKHCPYVSGSRPDAHSKHLPCVQTIIITKLIRVLLATTLGKDTVIIDYNWPSLVRNNNSEEQPRPSSENFPVRVRITTEHKKRRAYGRRQKEEPLRARKFIVPPK
jgi:hypothetical protein